MANRESYIAGCGYFVRTARNILLLAFFALATVPLASPASAETEAQLREMEASLLHRRIDLSSVKQWNAGQDLWRPLSLPPAKLVVVNLWSVHCKPCLEEMPLMRKIVQGWRGNHDVQFLFITDPPHDTEEGELEAFWRQPSVELPVVHPCRSTDERIRAALKTGVQPITLLLDEHFIVRQAFVGNIGNRNLAAAMERLLSVARVADCPISRKGR